jgi:hypothetical protein
MKIASIVPLKIPVLSLCLRASVAEIVFEFIFYAFSTLTTCIAAAWPLISHFSNPSPACS